MLFSKQEIKYILRLRNKKYRYQQNCFVAEGIKNVLDLLESPHIKGLTLFMLSEIKDDFKKYAVPKKYILQKDLEKISALKTPQKILAIFTMPLSKKNKIKEQGLILALDNIQDPGNLGTIIRLCDWFGITDLLCSKNTVDCFNPKVVQAAMGSLARVFVHYLDLEDFLEKTTLPIYTTHLQGDNIYQTKLPLNAVLIMGNEGRGVSENLLRFSKNHLQIPHFSKFKKPDSLNVSVATSIALSEFKRPKI